MSSSKSPLVSVVIPVYNGEAVIADAISSVLAQTYDNLQLTVANNCSTDGTAAIVEGIASRDSRVRLHNAAEFVGVIESHNRAFSLVSDDAEYCKILGADDWLFPNCLAELVDLAERNPAVGMVSSYFVFGSRVNAGAPFPRTVFSGREICRLRLINGLKTFGAPSSSLLRASAVRERRPFYDPLRVHADIDAYYDLLQRHDFGFVHQVLSYNCQGEKSPTSGHVRRLGGPMAAAVDEVERWGRIYLSPDEFRACRRDVWRNYYTLLADNVFELNTGEFWKFQHRFMRDLGYTIDYGRLSLYAMLRAANVAFNPLRTFTNVAHRIAEATRRKPAAPVAPALDMSLQARDTRRRVPSAGAQVNCQR